MCVLDKTCLRRFSNLRRNTTSVRYRYEVQDWVQPRISLPVMLTREGAKKTLGEHLLKADIYDPPTIATFALKLEEGLTVTIVRTAMNYTNQGSPYSIKVWQSTSTDQHTLPEAIQIDDNRIEVILFSDITPELTLPIVPAIIEDLARTAMFGDYHLSIVDIIRRRVEF